MNGFMTEKVRDGFYSITQGHVRCFLLLGEQDALLVDAGLGGADLKAHIESITRQPVRAVFTHADGDHVGHAAQFENRAMHPAEFDYYRFKAAEPVAMQPIWEGDVVSVGDRRFEVILLPGHTPGSIALLERRERFLIGGDNVQNGAIFMFGNGRNFEAFRASMQKLARLSGAFDTIYASHGDLALPPETIQVLDAAAAKVMAGQVPGSPNGRGLPETVRRYDTDGVAFMASIPGN